jgi:hypothetical protein
MQKRKQKLINPRLQLRLVAIFLCAAGLAVQVEAILIATTLSHLAGQMPNDGAVLLDQLPEFVRTNLLLTFLVLAPLMLGVGVVATFKIAGPLYRFEQFLIAVRDGTQVGPCRIRDGDELQYICNLLNEVTEAQRARAAGTPETKKLGNVEHPQPALPATQRETADKQG